jgi:hypothetical protein
LVIAESGIANRDAAVVNKQSTAHASTATTSVSSSCLTVSEREVIEDNGAAFDKEKAIDIIPTDLIASPVNR